jgi:hypothetical protein
MPEGNPIRGPHGEHKHARAPHRRDALVGGLLRDAIVGITCFPDPLPRGRKRKARRWWRRS